MKYDLCNFSATSISKEFWRRFDLGEVSEQELLHQLSCTYPEEVLAPLKAYMEQPILDREKLKVWCELVAAKGIRNERRV